VAVNTALQVISWFEHLPRKEHPPRYIWWSDRLLDVWFTNVEDERNAKTGKRSSYDDADDVPMMSNELADGLRPDGQ